MRMATCGVKLGSKYYNISDPLAINRDPDDKPYTLDHLKVKLYKLADLMNTEVGRSEAMERTKFMNDFVLKLNEEIRSEF
jgi:uncharacterized protein